MRYSLRRSPTGREYVVKGANWADWDQRGRLVFARDGKLFAARVDHPRELAVRELANFNEERPEPMEASPAARRW
jgi:hypothetical protein